MLKVQINKKFLISCFYLFSSCSYLFYIWLFPRLKHLIEDIEKNPGPKKDFFQTFSIHLVKQLIFLIHFLMI